MGGPHSLLHPAPGQEVGVGFLGRGSIQRSSQTLRAQALAERRVDGGSRRWR